MDLFTLVAKLILDTEKYDSAITEATDKGQTFEQKFKGVIDGVATALTAAGITAAISGIANAFSQMIANTAQYADTVDKGSQRLRLSTDAYQTWSHALSQSGANIDNLSRGVRTLNTALDDVVDGEYTGELGGVFAALQIDPTQYRTTEGLLDAVMTSLAAMGDTAERADIINQIFGPGGAQLNALLNSGVEGIQALRQEAYDLGLVMSGDEIANGVAYGDAVANLNAALEGVKQTLVRDIIPLLTPLIDTATLLLSLFNDRSNRGIAGLILGVQDEESAAISKAEQDATKAQGIINYLDQLVTKYGDAATNTEEWKIAMGQLEEVMPGVNDWIANQGGALTDTNAQLREYVQNTKEAAIANAKQAALQSYTDAYAAAVRDLGIAEINREIAQNQADVAWESLVNYVRQSEGQENFTGEGMSFDQLMFAARSTANELGDTSGVVETMGQAYTDATTTVTALDGEIVTLTQQSQLLATQMDIAAQAVERFSAAALSGGGGGGGTDSTGMNSGQYAAWYYGKKYGHAAGLDYVPFDEYPALLHRGEKILTASQARHSYEGSPDVVEAILALGNDMRQIRFQVGKKEFGRAVVDYAGDSVTNYGAQRNRQSMAGYGA